MQLELHYDDVHLENWRRKESNADKRMPARKREYKVFSSCSYTHRRKPNQRALLPQRVKNILRSPLDEKDWAKLEELREAIALEIEGARDYCFEPNQIEAVARALEACTSTKYYDEVAEGSFLPRGARVLVELHSRRGKIPTLRTNAAAAVRQFSDTTRRP